ncbi:MAG: hypothetical protein ACRD2H_14475 [Terriglobales bacterium]
MEIGIVGFGVVGHALSALFGGEGRVRIYDKFLRGYNGAAEREAVNRAEVAFIAVPTPMAADGSADVSAVEEVVAWLQASAVCIKSTVPPGTTDALSLKYAKPLCFSPEYVGETQWHPFKYIENHGFVIIGGPRPHAQHVLRAYQEVLGPKPRYVLTQAKLGEMAKYMENCFLATKVAFANQFFDLAAAMQIDFDELRELWLLDERVGRSHTVVTAERGFGGRCLPKDLSALIAAAKRFGGAPLLEAVQQFNETSRMRVARRPLAETPVQPILAGSGLDNGREARRAEL